MRTALIKDGKVHNIILTGDDYLPPAGYTAMPESEALALGLQRYIPPVEDGPIIWTASEFLRRIPSPTWAKIMAASATIPELNKMLLVIPTHQEIWSTDPDLNAMTQQLVTAGILTADEGRLILGEIDILPL